VLQLLLHHTASRVMQPGKQSDYLHLGNDLRLGKICYRKCLVFLFPSLQSTWACKIMTVKEVCACSG